MQNVKIFCYLLFVPGFDIVASPEQHDIDELVVFVDVVTNAIPMNLGLKRHGYCALAFVGFLLAFWHIFPEKVAFAVGYRPILSLESFRLLNVDSQDNSFTTFSKGLV